MPSFPQQPPLPGPSAASGSALFQWAETFIAAVRRILTTLAYTVNALSKVDTLANRVTTPDLNEIFFTTSDTKETFVGVAGAWQMVGPRRGSVTIAASATTAAVTLSPATADTSYRLTLSTNYNHGGLWWTSKATTGFTINAATAAPAGGATADWTLVRD